MWGARGPRPGFVADTKGGGSGWTGGGGLLGDNGAGINAIAAAAARAATHASTVAKPVPGRPPRLAGAPGVDPTSVGVRSRGPVSSGGVFKLSAPKDLHEAGPFGALLHIREGQGSDILPNIDLKLLDQCVDAFYVPTMPNTGYSSRHEAEQAMLHRQQQAAAAMGSLRSDPESWYRVHGVILKTKSSYTRAFAASTLAFALQYQWDRIPAPAREGIKRWSLQTIASVAAYLSSGVPKDSAQAQQRRQVHEFLRCLAQVVLSAAKHCWPQDWAGLTPGLVQIARRSEGACGAALEVFKRLAEDVYPAGAVDERAVSTDPARTSVGGQLSSAPTPLETSEEAVIAYTASAAAVTTAAMRRLQLALRAEVPRVITLLKQVLGMAKSPDLVATALACLSVYIPLCPLPVLLNKKDGILGILLRRHLPEARHRAHALECVAEIGHRRVGSWATDVGGRDVNDVSSGSDFLRCPDMMFRKAAAAGRGVRLPGKHGPGTGRSSGGSEARFELDSDSDDDAIEASRDDPDESSGYGMSLTLAQTNEACSPVGIADGIGAALAAVVAQAVKILPRGDAASASSSKLVELDGTSAIAVWSLAAYDDGNPAQTQYLAALSCVLTSLCSGRWGFFHTRGAAPQRLLASACELQAELMSVSHDDATFQNAVDFWKSASEAMLRSAKHVARRSKGVISDLAVLLDPVAAAASPSKVADFSSYRGAVYRVRKVCVARMGKPKEVLLVVDEDTGEIERYDRTDLHELAVFRDLRRILRNLAPLGGRDTVGLLLKRLDACNTTTRALSESAGSHGATAGAGIDLLQEYLRHRNSVNKLCWSLGAVSGTLPPDVEARFLVTSVKGLLDMTDRAKGRDDKGVVASGIMYVCGQYPRFLRKHWRFLETVTDKLCEFCGETRSPAVQDMAVEHLVRIARACAESFVVRFGVSTRLSERWCEIFIAKSSLISSMLFSQAPQPGRPRPYIVDLCRRAATICANLAPHQAETFFKACGVILARCPPGKPAESITDSLLDAPLQYWRRIVTAAHSNLQILQSPDTALYLARLAKLLKSTAAEMGSKFARPLGKVFLDAVNLIRALGAFILHIVTGPGGPPQLRSDSGRAMKAARKALLELVRAFVRTGGKESPLVVAKEFLPHIVPHLTAHVQESAENEKNAATVEPAAIALLRDCCRGATGGAVLYAGHLGKIATAAAESVIVAFPLAGRRIAAFAQSEASLPSTVTRVGLNAISLTAPLRSSSSSALPDGKVWGGWSPSSDASSNPTEQFDSVGGRSVELRLRFLSLCTALLALPPSCSSASRSASATPFATSVAAMGATRTLGVCEMGLDAVLSVDRRLTAPGLRLLIRMVRGFYAAPAEFSLYFFRVAWLRIATAVLVALTDCMHAGDLDLHAALMGELFAVLESRAVGGPLWTDGDCPPDAPGSASTEGDDATPAAYESNEEWVGYHLGIWLGSSFPHLGKERVVAFAGGLARAGAAIAGEADEAARTSSHLEMKRLLADFAVESLQLRPKEVAELFADDPIAAAAALGVDVARD